MAKYSKMFGTMIGGLIGMAVAWAAVNLPGVTSCVDVANPDTCTTLGLTTTQITGVFVALFAVIGTERAPKNA
jgi:hypothetical protein